VINIIPAAAGRIQDEIAPRPGFAYRAKLAEAPDIVDIGVVILDGFGPDF
jgi:hypothetical protein